ncbi:DUF1016 N-terminal domain-containing protein [Microbacterium sp.]|uniref:DUF1016 N-terminal domain-containing protein n=1 Tax=Microbacterium sp. TaxID=51671 RepID=UPI0035615580
MRLWRQTGRTIRDRQEDASWGDSVLTRLATGPRREFPAMTGFSITNLKDMRRFVATWAQPDLDGQRPVDHLPWARSSI